MQKKVIAPVLLITGLFLLSSCRSDYSADWEDSLPSVVVRKSETEMVIQAETSPVIILDDTLFPTVTTTIKTEPELATSTGLDTYNEELDGIPKITILPPKTSETLTETTSVPAATGAVSDITYSGTTYSGTVHSQTVSDSYVSSSLSVTESDMTVNPNGSDKFEHENIRNLDRPYSYEFLSPLHKYIYDSIINAMDYYKTELTIPGAVDMNYEDYLSVFQLLYNEEITSFYLGNFIGYTGSDSQKNIVLEYKYPKQEVIAMKNDIDSAAGQILEKITDDMSEYDIVKLFFDELAFGCEYEQDKTAPHRNDIYGCLVEKSAWCGGFSKTFSYLCGKVGIESIIITGDIIEKDEQMPHMWNMVKIDGEWYHIDVTTGCALTDMTNEAGEDVPVKYIRYDFFCVTDNFLKNDHVIKEQNYDYPVADDSSGSYFARNNLIARDYEQAEKLLISESLRVSGKRGNCIQIQCSSSAVYDEVVSNFITGREAVDILNGQLENALNKYNAEPYTYNLDSGTRVIKFILEYSPFN